MLIDCPLAEAAMLPQPALELDHTAVRCREPTRCLVPHNRALAEEHDEPVYPLHILAGDLLLSTHARTPAAVPREATDDDLVDVGDRSLYLHQPVREVAGGAIKASHGKVRIPSLRQLARELRHQRGKIARIHAPAPTAPTFTRLDHAMLPYRCR